MSEALRGIRVLELAGRPGALAGRILADLGAEVILVEPGGGAPIRHEVPALEGAPAGEGAFSHLYFNTNKKSVVLNLNDRNDQAAFLKLVATADVILDSHAPGELDDLGLSFESLRGLNRGLIQCSITPFGMTTEWRDRKANDLVAGAAGGLIQVSGSARGTPVQGGANPSYTMSGLAAASAITMALHQRDLQAESNGCGVHIDLSMQEATALAVMQTATPSIWQWRGRIPKRPGLSAAMACRDGKYVSLLVRPDRFQGFLAWADEVGIDHGMTDEDWHYARLESPRENNPVSETTLKLAEALTRDEFVEGALKADIICLPVLDFPDLEQAEQYRINDQFLSLQHEVLGAELGYVRSPVDAMADGVSFERAPTLGEHQSLIDDLADAEPHNNSLTELAPEKALAGIRVVDFGWVLAAPIGTRLLASFGAEVIRIESTTKPDSMRSQLGPDGEPHPDLGGLYNVVNAGKKSLTVDLTKPEGMALVKDLIRTADVVVNNFRPGALDRMGFGYDVLRELKDDIVLLNLPGAHRHGPWAQRPSMGNILMAASGFNMLTGFDGDRPRGIGIAYPDFTSPHLLVATVVAALRQRQQNGQGQELHLTQLSAVLSLLGAEWMEFKATGQQPPRNANRNPNYCPHGIYPAREETDPAIDAWVAIAVANDDEWVSFCDVVGMPALADDPRFATMAARLENQDEVDRLVSEWTTDRDKWDISDMLQSFGIAAAPVENLRDMLEVDPQMARHYQMVTQPAAPDVSVPVDLEAARWNGEAPVMTRAPMLGEHNQQVVQDILGRSDEAFVELIAGDVLS